MIEKHAFLVFYSYKLTDDDKHGKFYSILYLKDYFFLFNLTFYLNGLK